MWFGKGKADNTKTVEDLYNEVNNLMEQQETLRKKIADSYPIIDSLNKIREELEEVKTKNKELEQLNNNVESLSQHNNELVRRIRDLKNIRWFWFILLLAGGVFLWFCANCSWQLLSLINEYTIWQKLITIIIGVVMVLLIMAAVLIYFAHKTQQYLSQKKGN